MSATTGQIQAMILAQVAAESYLDGISYADLGLLRQRLRLGSNRFSNFENPEISSLVADLPNNSRMTDVQIAQFVERYDVVDHLPNTITGFSATLLWDRPDNKKAEKWVRSCNPTFPPLDCCHGKTIKNRIGGRAVSHYFAR